MVQLWKISLLFTALAFLGGCDSARYKLIEWFTPEYNPPGDPSRFEPLFQHKDQERQQIEIELYRVTDGFQKITDIQFIPDRDNLLIVLEQEGRAYLVDLENEQRSQFLDLPVLTASEQGLLGLAFHPDYHNNFKFYINYSLQSNGKDISRVSEWQADIQELRNGLAGEERILMEIEQPYPNHNAGQLAFGPDELLYIGWGDGGWRGDPLNAGQDPSIWLGSMLRIDVNPSADRPYTIPGDNPFVEVGDDGSIHSVEDYAPETFAYGLRNPWRYSFDPYGRLIVADVGQDKWEIVSIVQAGENHGWRYREGRNCYNPETNCPVEGLVDPVYEYGHDEGNSITGGFVYTGNMQELQGLYIFGDFVQGRMWAIELPAPSEADFAAENPDPMPEAIALGKWPILISTFGQDSSGEIYLSGYASGTVYRIGPQE